MITKQGKRVAAMAFTAMLCFALPLSQSITAHAANGLFYGSENPGEGMQEEYAQEWETSDAPKSIIELQYGDQYEDYEYPELYVMTEVSSHVHTIGSEENVTIQCSGELKDFSSVQVDGILVDAGNYYLDEGSTILTFVAKYLDTLSVGRHSVTLNYTYDSIDTELTILAPAEVPPEETGGTMNGIQGNVSDTVSGVYNSGNPVAVKTGDQTPIVFWVLAMMAALGTCVVFGVRKRTV